MRRDPDRSEGAMNPLQKLKQFKTPGVPAPMRPATFTYKGIEYATPSAHTLRTPGFFNSTRGRAYAASVGKLPP
jgi:hypothetical protein